MISWSSWKRRWQIFCQLIVDPLTIILLILLVVFAKVLTVQVDIGVKAILTLVISIVSAVLGSIIYNRWSSLNEEKIIIARGKVAVRSLKLLLGNIIAIDSRVREYLSRFCSDLNKTKNGKIIFNEIVKTYLEEIIKRCVLLEEETLSSIENWTDIIPEADVKTQIGIITRLREEVQNGERDLQRSKAELDKISGKSKEKEKQLRNEIKEKGNELAKLKTELYEKKSIIDADMYNFDFLSLSGSRYMCNDCQHVFLMDTKNISDVCPKCDSKNIGICP